MSAPGSESEVESRAGLRGAVALLEAPYVGRRVLRVAAALFALAWLSGALIFLRADGSLTWTMPQQAARPAGPHNLAFYRFGPTLRASSYFREPYEQNHPVFLVDGRTSPGELEKWSSSPRDQAPWVELLWRTPATLSSVTIRHAGSREDASRTVRDYRLLCLQAEPGHGAAPELVVRGNQAALVSHPLPCERARGVRIEWSLPALKERVRIYEVEAWGQ